MPKFYKFSGIELFFFVVMSPVSVFALSVGDPRNVDVSRINSASQYAGKFEIPSSVMMSRRKHTNLTNKPCP